MLFKLSQSTYHFSVKPLASFLLVVTLKTLTIFGPALLYKALPTMGVACTKSGKDVLNMTEEIVYLPLVQLQSSPLMNLS